mgnify:CR=1 FL=1
MAESPSGLACGGGVGEPTCGAWAAAWKIRHGERRGFEDGLWDAQAQNRDGRWVVIARRASKRRSIPGEGMDPLF